MPTYRLGTAAHILGISVDSVRRLANAGKLRTTRSEGGQRIVDGADLAKYADQMDRDRTQGRSSARNQFKGIVTRVVRDKVAAQVELRCGPFRLVSLVTRESVDALGLEPGSLAVAVVKATNVVIELAPAPTGESPDHLPAP